MHISRHFPFLALTLTALAWIGPASAAVTLQGLFSDHMVVQRDMPVPIFGAASPNETVTVKLGTQQAEGKAGADGRFLVKLPAQPAGGPFELTVNTTVFKDVYVGEVWLASGQSNMDFRVDCKIGWSHCSPPLQDMAKEIADATNPLIRMITINRKGSGTPQTTMVTQKWAVGIKEAIKPFSAVGYFFAREVQKSLPGVAVGIVHASFGASCIECWMSKEALAEIPSFKPLLDAYEKKPAHGDQHNPYNCYNGQIYPVKPYAVRGAIWYQGESILDNVKSNMLIYRDLQVGLVKSWQKEWGQEMTFVIAQLANHRSANFPEVREAQMHGAMMVPNTGLAVTIDIGHETNIHPVNKQDVGLRMGLAARYLAYKQPIVHSGPLYTRMEVEGSAIRLFFKHSDGGLELRGGNATTFEIAGSNGAFVPATAKVDKDSTLLVSAASVTTPMHVRYAWAPLPAVSLYNKAAPTLPASPFRTNGAPIPVSTKPSPGAPESIPSSLDFRVVRHGNSGTVSLVYTLSQPARVSLALFNVRGRKWSAAGVDRKEPGMHSVQISLGSGLGGKGLDGEGLYFARLKVDGQEKVIPVVF